MRMCAAPWEPFRPLVELRLIPALRRRKVFKLEHHQAGRFPVTFQDGEFAAAGEIPATACRDGSRRCCLVVLVTLGVRDVGFDDDIRRHGPDSTPVIVRGPAWAVSAR